MGAGGRFCRRRKVPLNSKAEGAPTPGLDKLTTICLHGGEVVQVFCSSQFATLETLL